MNVRFITPDLHGILDYAAAIALIVAPFALDLKSHSELVFWFSIVAGAGLIAYSALTDYALSIKGLFSFKVHLILDAVASTAFLLLAFVHGGTAVSVAYCLVMGGGVVVVVALSRQSDTAQLVMQ